MSRLSLQQRLKGNDPLFSVEFFPPKSDETAQQLLQAAKRIQAFEPDFVSITYGAGGGTRNRTLKYAKHLHEDYGFDVMPHLTCVGHSCDELKQIINEFKDAGLHHIMALRGDPPKGETNFTPHVDGLSYANNLVRLIRDFYPECAIGVAGYPEKHPEAPSPEIDLLNLKRKVDAGATFITTQLFFDNAIYFKFVEKCRMAGITIPILPGLMSITSYKQALRFCEMCGTSIPDELNQKLLEAGDDTAAVEQIGVDWTYQQARELLEKGAPGIHLYILNRAAPVTYMMEKLQAAGFYKKVIR
jgi:methylenetetrahydrofolate reductase (NADPH)